MSGLRPSLRLPSRMVPICVVEPIGLASPRRTASTPAINVVATAPMPGIMTPNFPVAGFIFAACVAASELDITERKPFYEAIFRGVTEEPVLRTEDGRANEVSESAGFSGYAI